MPTKKKPTLNLMYPCYICKEDVRFLRGPQLISHFKDIHGLILPSRKRGIKRPPNAIFNYQSDFNKVWNDQHMACPSCWYHSKELDPLEKHIRQQHGLLKERYDRETVLDIFYCLEELTSMFKRLVRM